MRARRSGLVAVAAATLAMTLAGCNHDQSSGTEALDAPQSASAPGPSASGSPGGSLSPSAASPSTPAAPAAPSSTQPPPPGGHVLGVHQLAAAIRHTITTYHSVHVAVRMTGGSTALRAQGDVRYTAHGPLMRMQMHMPALGTGTVKVLMVHQMVYLAMPPMTPRGRWVAIDPSDPNSPLGPSAGAVTKMNPLHSFEVVEKGVRKLRYVGPGTVQGEPASHYKVTVDTRAAAQATGQPVNPMVPRMVSYDIWLDMQNRMRRMRLQQLGATVVSDLSDWGVPVHVHAPPPSRVLTFENGGA